MKIKALLCDVDGTLIDTVEVIQRGQYEAAIQHYLAVGLQKVDLPTYDAYQEALLKVVGGHVRDTLEATSHLLFANRPDIITKLDFDEMTQIMRPIQEELALTLVRPYEGLQSLLRYLGEHSIRFGIFTSGRPHHLVCNFGTALPELGLKDLYKQKDKTDYEMLHELIGAMEKNFGLRDIVVITGDDVAARKPDPESIFAACEKFGMSSEDIAVLGDHKVDMQAASNARVPVRIGVVHGFDDSETLMAAGATTTITNLANVAASLESSRK
jgi:phosphoglycolate phosphatase-like HAD superfamily hydrolase